jgi:hypothetical protein
MTSRAKRLSKASECRHRVVRCRARLQSGCDHKWPGLIPWPLRDRPGWEPRGGDIGSPLHPRFRYPSHIFCLSASEKELRVAISPSAVARLSRRALLAGSPGPKPPFDGIEEKMALKNRVITPWWSEIATARAQRAIRRNVCVWEQGRQVAVRKAVQRLTSHRLSY